MPGDANGAEDIFVHGGASPVGGIAELPGLVRTPAETPSPSGVSVETFVVIAASAAAGAVATGGLVWYARRRRVI